MKQLIEAIESAYCWEGGARAKITSQSPTNIEFDVRGSSTVEHSGDVDGICDQVRGLRNQSFVEGEQTFTITSATIKTKSGERVEDEDYSVSVDGKVSVKIG
jgi:hypothetical protein